MLVIGIIDSFPVLRRGIAVLLGNYLKGGYFLDARDVDELPHSGKRYNLLILGLNNNGRGDFQETLDYVKTNFSGTPVIIYAETLRNDVIIAYLRSELSGYIVKSTDSTELIRCVEDVLDGRRYLCQSFTEDILRSVLCEFNSNSLMALRAFSYREFRVACYMGEGASIEAIAQLLGMKVSTVERLARRIVQKVSVGSLGDLSVRYSPSTGGLGKPTAQSANLRASSSRRES